MSAIEESMTAEQRNKIRVADFDEVEFETEGESLPT